MTYSQEIIRKITPVLRQHGVLKAGLFGSATSNQMQPSSDVDILVELDKKTGLFDFISIKLDLETVLNRSVDLVEYKAIKPRIRNVILQQEIPIYG